LRIKQKVPLPEDTVTINGFTVQEAPAAFADAVLTVRAWLLDE